MKILAIEASGPVAGAALHNGEKLLGEMSLQTGLNHSVTLMPLVEELLARTGTQTSELTAIALTAGPGSFTGLRIGAATAKGLAFALSVPVVPVSTLDSLACNLPFANGLVCPLMDARKGQVYAALYRCGSGRPVRVLEPEALALPDFLAKIPEGEPVVFLGDGAYANRGAIEAIRPENTAFAPETLGFQKASSTAQLAVWRCKEEGEEASVSSADLRLTYLRKSQAEKQRDEAEANGLMDALKSGTLVQRLKERGLS